MLLYVDTSSGSTFTIVSNRRARVLDVKQKIEKTQGMAVSTQDLYYKGEALLINDLRLEQCNIVNHSRLLLILPGHKDYRVPPRIEQSLVPSNNIVEDSLGKNQDCPAMATSNKLQMLHQTEHCQVPPSNTVEAFDNQGWPAMAMSNNEQMLHQTKQSLVPSNEAEDFFNKDWSAMAISKEDQMLDQPEKSILHSFSVDKLLELFPETTLTDQDMRKMQGFWPVSTTQGNVNIQESSGRNDNNQDLLQREPYSTSKTSGNFSFGEDRPLSTERLPNSQCNWPAGTSEEIINKNQVFQTEQSTVQSNSTEQMIKTPDLPVRVRRRNQVVQIEKSQPIREVKSLKIPPQKQRVKVFPYSRDNKPVSKFPVDMNASENVEELRKEVGKIQQRTQLNLPSSNPRELEDEAGTWASAPHPNQVSEASPHNAPSELELRYQLFLFASSFNRRSMRHDYLKRLNERLGIYNSTPERRRQILQGMHLISALQGHDRPDSGRKAGDALVDFIRKWDQQQD